VESTLVEVLILDGLEEGVFYKMVNWVGLMSSINYKPFVWCELTGGARARTLVDQGKTNSVPSKPKGTAPRPNPRQIHTPEWPTLCQKPQRVGHP
jgi:hypothetical protein